ncbi:MAG: polyprenyl synthetase family protein [Patescibacteria group bacterium]
MKSERARAGKAKLLDFVKLIDKELTNYFKEELKNIFGVSKKEKELNINIMKHIMEHNLRPAKRLRGSFIYYGYRLFKNDKESEIKKVAMSIELIHTALLMHDDFMDQDDTRRGKPTSHEYYKDYHIKNKFRFSSQHYGESMAVTVGDTALMLGFEILGKSNFDTNLKINALNRTFRGITNTTYGQTFDITLEGKGVAMEKDITDLHLAKTAIYTYENPLHIGAILAGADKKDLEILSRYAIPAGVGFQLQDDMLGLFGDTEKTGKPAHSDLRQGKMTLLIIKALEWANKEQKAKLLSIWGNRNLTDSDANIARQIVKDTGSLDYSIKTAHKWVKKAQKAIPEMQKLKWNRESIDYLDGIAQYMVERDY